MLVLLFKSFNFVNRVRDGLTLTDFQGKQWTKRNHFFNQILFQFKTIISWNKSIFTSSQYSIKG